MSKNADNDSTKINDIEKYKKRIRFILQVILQYGGDCIEYIILLLSFDFIILNI